MYYCYLSIFGNMNIKALDRSDPSYLISSLTDLNLKCTLRTSYFFLRFHIDYELTMGVVIMGCMHTLLKYTWHSLLKLSVFFLKILYWLRNINIFNSSKSIINSYAAQVTRNFKFQSFIDSSRTFENPGLVM